MTFAATDNGNDDADFTFRSNQRETTKRFNNIGIYIHGSWIIFAENMKMKYTFGSNSFRFISKSI